MRHGALLVAGLVLACSQGAAGAQVSPSPSPPPTVSPQPSPQVSPPPALGPADYPITRLGFTCNLPVSFHQGGGFVSFPAGSLKPDPAAALEVVDGAQGLYRTVAVPHLYGHGGLMSYDRARSRWLPSPREAISADGARYAYGTGDPSAQKLHVVEVATGAEQVLELPGFPLIAVVLHFTSAGIYLTSGYEGPPVGLWFVDLSSGGLQKIADLRGVIAISGGFVWLSTQEKPPPPNAYFPSDSIVSYDLRSGERVIWFQPPGAGRVWVSGFDTQGGPVVSVAPPGDQPAAPALWIVPQPGEGRLIDDGRLNLSPDAADQHGLWLSNSWGLFLYSDGRLARVTDGSGHAVGPCL